MIGLYTLGAAHGAPGFFDVGAENMPRKPIEDPGRHKADIGDCFSSGGCAVRRMLSCGWTSLLKPKIYGWSGILDHHWLTIVN